MQCTSYKAVINCDKSLKTIYVLQSTQRGIHILLIYQCSTTFLFFRTRVQAAETESCTLGILRMRGLISYITIQRQS